MKISGSMVIGVILGFSASVGISYYLQNSSLSCEAQSPVVTTQSVTPFKVTTAPASSAISPEDLMLTQRLSKVFNHIAKNVNSSVVHITAEKNVQSNQMPQGMGPMDEEMLRRFFPDRFGSPRGRQQQRRPQVGLGSGVIIGTDGYIVTNNHVVADADKVKVVLSDGRELTPEWIRTDPATDLALIKIEAEGLHALELADSEALEVGDIVLAMGNPFGLDQTVTQGIISYIGRGIQIDSSIKYSNYIQTDAAVNPGNSGGPLVNLKGQIIGINSAIISRTSSYAGISFAIPSNTVKFVASQLRDSEKVMRSYLGVSIQNLTPPLAKSFGLDHTDGTIITDVGASTPASKAGLKAGDVILTFDGSVITDRQKLQNLVAMTPPGSEVELTIWRDGEEKSIIMTMEKMPKEFLAGRMSPLQSEDYAITQTEEIEELGLTVQTLNKELAEQYKFKSNLKGALIVDIALDGEGARAGLAQGNLITKIQNKDIASAKELMDELAKHSLKEGVTLYVRSASGGARFVYIKID